MKLSIRSVQLIWNPTEYSQVSVTGWSPIESVQIWVVKEVLQEFDSDDDLILPPNTSNITVRN